MTDPEATTPNQPIAIVGGRGSEDVTGEIAIPTQPVPVVPSPDAPRTMVQPAILPLEPMDPPPSPARRAAWPVAAGLLAVVAVVARALATTGDPTQDVVPTTTSTVSTAAEVDPSPLVDEEDRPDPVVEPVPTTAPVVTEPADDGFEDCFPFCDEPQGPGKKDKEKGRDD